MNRGFTLLEVIATITLLALLGGMGATTISNTKAKIFQSRAYLSDAVAAQDAMEDIKQEFEALLEKHTNTAGGAYQALLTMHGGDSHIAIQEHSQLIGNTTQPCALVTVTYGTISLSRIFAD